MFAGRLEEHAHRLAQHFELAGDDTRAMRYLEMAGDAAAGLDARTEADAHYAGAMAAARRLGNSEQAIAALQVKREVLGADPPVSSATLGSGVPL